MYDMAPARAVHVIAVPFWIISIIAIFAAVGGSYGLF